MAKNYVINLLVIKLKNGDDCTTGCFLDFQHFKDHYQLTKVNLSNQTFHANPRAIQQNGFYEMLKINSQVCTILGKKKKKNNLGILQRNSKSFVKYK